MEKKDNSGALFTNDKKQKETHPDLNGKVVIAGTEYYLSAWKKQTKDGKNYLSLSFKPVEDQVKNTVDDFLNF